MTIQVEHTFSIKSITLWQASLQEAGWVQRGSDIIIQAFIHWYSLLSNLDVARVSVEHSDHSCVVGNLLKMHGTTGLS